MTNLLKDANSRESKENLIDEYIINYSKDIEWGPLGKPSPDADCLDGDMIMCLLAGQGIFLHLWRYEPSIIQSNASRANGPFGVVENKIRNSRNLGIVSTCWFISSLWYCSYLLSHLSF